MIQENPVLPSEELVDNNTTDINVLMEDQLAEEKLPEEYDVAVNIFPKKILKPKDDVTYKDKTHGSTINEAMEKQQEILKTKVPDNKMYTFEEGTGNVIFRNFSENEQQIIEEVMTDLQMGKLQPIEGSLQTTLRDIEGSIFDSKATLQDAVATYLKQI